MKKLKQLIEDYGFIALGTYMGTFAVAMVGFVVAIRLGFEPDGVAGGAGTLLAAWLATKATQPIRIAATLALTPVVARLVRRNEVAAMVPSTPEAAAPEAAPAPEAVRREAG
jgi:hypothetical protein